MKTEILSGSILRVSLRNLACCKTSGLVGAKNIILSLSFSSLFAIIKRAIIVLPSPVGNTTNVLCFKADLAMLSWYDRSCIVSGFMNLFLRSTKKVIKNRFLFDCISFFYSKKFIIQKKIEYWDENI